MTIKFSCPHCGQRISAEETQLGKQGKCPVCNQPFIVPEVETSGTSAPSPTIKSEPNSPLPTKSRTLSTRNTIIGCGCFLGIILVFVIISGSFDKCSSGSSNYRRSGSNNGEPHYGEKAIIDGVKASNPEEVAQINAAVQASAAQRAAEDSALAAATAAAEAKIAADAAANQEKAQAANAVRIKGSILQATNEGLLVKCMPYIPVVSGSASFGGGGGVYAPPDPNGVGRPNLAYGTFWIIGHPEQNSKVDDDAIDIDAYESGIHSYISVDGAARRVKQYKVIKSFK